MHMPHTPIRQRTPITLMCLRANSEARLCTCLHSSRKPQLCLRSIANVDHAYALAANPNYACVHEVANQLDVNEDRRET